MSRKDIFYQRPCSNCGKYVYEEVLRPDGAGGGICDSCYIQQISLGKKSVTPLDRPPMPRGILLIEILGVVLILAFIVGFVTQTVLPMKKKADMAKLELLYLASQDSEIGRLAEEAIALIEKEQSLEGLKKIVENPFGEPGQAANPEQLPEGLVAPGVGRALTQEQKKEIEEFAQAAAGKQAQYKQSLESFARVGSISSQEIAELESELKKSLELKNHSQQVGSAITAIQEWQKKLERRVQEARDHPLSTFR